MFCNSSCTVNSLITCCLFKRCYFFFYRATALYLHHASCTPSTVCLLPPPSANNPSPYTVCLFSSPTVPSTVCLFSTPTVSSTGCLFFSTTPNGQLPSTIHFLFSSTATYPPQTTSFPDIQQLLTRPILSAFHQHMPIVTHPPQSSISASHTPSPISLTPSPASFPPSPATQTPSPVTELTSSFTQPSSPVIQSLSPILLQPYPTLQSPSTSSQFPSSGVQPPHSTLRRGTKRRRSAEEETTLARELEDLGQYRANSVETANNRNILLQTLMRQEEHHTQLMLALTQINNTIHNLNTSKKTTLGKCTHLFSLIYTMHSLYFICT